MTVSAITGITQEGQPQEISSFLRAGVVYVLWHSPISLGLRRLSWKPHNALNFTEVVPSLGQAFRGVSAIYDPGSDHVVVVWDDGAFADGSNSGMLSTARFDPMTGRLISGPTQLFPGSNPKLSYRTTQSSNLLLYYRTAKNLGVYGRVSADGGLTWESGYPIWTGQVSNTSAVEVVSYGSNHAGIAQIGTDSRRLTELGLLKRTRPLASIVKHPTVADQFFIAEPSKFDNTTLTDNLRGALVLSTDNTKLYNLDGVQQGTADVYGAVSRIKVTGTAIDFVTTSPSDDANTFVHWKLDESSASAAAVPTNGLTRYNLDPINSPGVFAGQIDGCRTFDGVNQAFQTADSATVLAETRPMLLGAWTIECWVRASLGAGAQAGMVICSFGALGETQPTNALLTLTNPYGTDIAIIWENGAGINVTTLFTSCMTRGEWYHVAVTKSASIGSPGNWDVAIYINGGQTSMSAAALANADGGTDSTMGWVVGRSRNDATAANHYWGRIDDIRISNVARSLSEIRASYQAGRGSAGPSGNGDDVRGYNLNPGYDTLNVDLPGTSYAVDMAVSSTHGYVAEYADNSGTAGQFVVVDLSTGTTGTVLSGLTGVRAVAVANFLSPPRIFVATTESGVERLRVYEQNALTPTLLLNTKLTSRANALSVAPDPSNPTGALVYASLVDRLNVYRYVSSSAPVQLVDSLTLPGGGSFFRSQVASNGNIFVAAGNAGLLCLGPDGKILAQTVLSGEVISEWTRSTVYPAGALVRPRDVHQFARSRYYFRTVSGGTSGNGEPGWASSGSVTDNTVSWTAVGLVDGVATAVAIDEANDRVLVAGSAGGNLGTDGRVWLVTAAGLL